MGNFRIEFYTTENRKCQVRDFLRRAPKRHRAKIGRWILKLEEEGHYLPRPYADTLESGIRELRIPIEHHQYRLLHFIHHIAVVITNAFLKKGDKVPDKEIKIAKHCRADWLRRFG